MYDISHQLISPKYIRATSIDCFCSLSFTCSVVVIAEEKDLEDNFNRLDYYVSFYVKSPNGLQPILIRLGKIVN